jgi:hypothetical protein
MTIQVVARVTGLHPQTLRKYERWGYVTPARTLSNMRLYTVKDVEEIKRIRRLTETLHLNQAGVELVTGIQGILNHSGDDHFKIIVLKDLLSGIEQGRGHIYNTVIEQGGDDLVPSGEGELELTPVPTGSIQVRGSWGPQNVTFRCGDDSTGGGVDLDDVTGRVEVSRREIE